jgi:hypothetical protein
MFDRYSANPLGDGFWKLGNNGHKSMTLAGPEMSSATPIVEQSWRGSWSAKVAQEAGGRFTGHNFGGSRVFDRPHCCSDCLRSL